MSQITLTPVILGLLFVLFALCAALVTVILVEQQRRRTLRNTKLTYRPLTPRQTAAALKTHAEEQDAVWGSRHSRSSN